MSMTASHTVSVYSRSGEIDVIARTGAFPRGELQFPILARFYRAVTRNSVQDVQTGCLYPFSSKPGSGKIQKYRMREITLAEFSANKSAAALATA